MELLTSLKLCILREMIALVLSDILPQEYLANHELVIMYNTVQSMNCQASKTLK